MTITKSATARLSRVSVGLTRHDSESDPSVLLSVDVGGFSVNLYVTLEDFDILRETFSEFDVHEALQLEEDAKAPVEPEERDEGSVEGLAKLNYGRCPVEGPFVLGGRLHSEPELEDDSVDPVGGDIETATLLKSKTHDCWVECVQNFEKGPRYQLHFRTTDGQMHMRTGDSWCYSRTLAIHRMHQLEQSGEAMVRA